MDAGASDCIHTYTAGPTAVLSVRTNTLNFWTPEMNCSGRPQALILVRDTSNGVSFWQRMRRTHRTLAALAVASRAVLLKIR